MNIAKGKRILTDNRFATLAQDVIDAREIVNEVSSVITPKQIEIMKNHGFKTNNPERFYLLEEDEYEIYQKEINAFMYSDECPYKPMQEGNCPKLEAETKYREKRSELIDLAELYFGISFDDLITLDNGTKEIEGYTDLLIGLYKSSKK